MKASFVGDTNLIANRRTIVNKFIINRYMVFNAGALRKSRLLQTLLAPSESLGYALHKI
jgi:hypothetical protein